MAESKEPFRQAPQPAGGTVPGCWCTLRSRSCWGRRTYRRPGNSSCITDRCSGLWPRTPPRGARWPCSTGHPGEDHEGAGEGASACVESAPSAAGRLPVADGGGKTADRLDHHRHRRHHHHLGVEEGRGGGHLQKDVRVSPAGRVVREHHRVLGHAPATGQCRCEHGGRPPRRTHRGHRPDPRLLGREDPRPGGRRRSHPRAAGVLGSPEHHAAHGALHRRLEDHR